MDYDVLKVWKEKIPKHTLYCFWTGMIVGLLTHFYMLTHKLPNWDDMNNMSAPGSGDYLGRWFLKYIHPLGSIYSIPAVHGVLFIVCLSLAACIVLEIAQIKSLTGAILVPTVMVTFSSVACTMTFMFMAHTSGIGILMACLSVYLFRKYKFGFIPAFLLIIFTLGTYQSFISIVITLMLIGMLVDLIKGKNAWDSVKHGLCCVVLLLVGVGIYMLLSHLIYPAIDQETYGGVGNMGQIAIADMPILIGRCYKRFLEFFLWKPFAFMTKTSQVMNILTSICGIVVFVYLLTVKKMYQKPFECILVIVVAGFIPLAAAFIYFMAPEVDYSMLMLYSYALIYVLVLALLEVTISNWQKLEMSGSGNHFSAGKFLRQVVVLGTVAVIFISSYTNYLVTNKAYLRTEIACERVTNYFNRMIARIESTEGFVEGEPVTILGNTYYKENPSSVEFDVMDSESLREMSGVALENGLLTLGVRDNFIRVFVGYDVANISDSEKHSIMESEEYKKMPSYPSDGCVRKIHNVWVLKMCD